MQLRDYVMMSSLVTHTLIQAGAADTPRLDVPDLVGTMEATGAMVPPVQEETHVTPMMLRALDIVLPWGPQRMRPEALRLQEAAPDATPNEIAEAIRRVHAIEERAYELTEECWSEGAPRPADEFEELSREAAAVLADDFSFLSPGTITQLVSQAHYLHSK